MPTLNYTIRSGLPTDSEKLTELAFRSKASWGYPKEWIEKWRNELTVTPEMLEKGVVFVAEYDAQIIGFWCRQAIQTDNITQGFLFIDPDYFGHGIASNLWQHMKAALIKKGITHFTLEADPNAAPFYKSIGGVKIGDKDSLVVDNRKIPIMKFKLSK